MDAVENNIGQHNANQLKPIILKHVYHFHVFKFQRMSLDELKTQINHAL